MQIDLRSAPMFVRSFRLWLCIVLLVAAGSAPAAENSHFAVGACQSGELQFIQGVPVVTVSGTPEEMGQQLGTLLKRPLGELLEKQDTFVRSFGFGKSASMFVKTGQLLLPKFSEPYRLEMETMAKASNVDLNFLILGNLMYELSKVPACSTLSVDADRSAADGPLFGRNFDFPTLGFLDKYSLLIVYRPNGKHAFASAAFPGIVGVFTGMNDAGLCLAQLEVPASAENSPRVDLGGTPIDLCFRRVLEECTSVDEAEKLLRQQHRMLMCNVALCDRHQSAVLEMTTKTVVRRPADHGLCACTNHFRTAGLTVDKQCPRYAKLASAQLAEKLAVGDVARLLNAVNQGGNTIQTMIFEPASLRVRLSFGPLPSSSQQLKPIDLGSLLGGSDEARAGNSAPPTACALTRLPRLSPLPSLSPALAVSCYTVGNNRSDNGCI